MTFWIKKYIRFICKHVNSYIITGIWLNQYTVIWKTITQISFCYKKLCRLDINLNVKRIQKSLIIYIKSPKAPRNLNRITGPTAENAPQRRVKTWICNLFMRRSSPAPAEKPKASKCQFIAAYFENLIYNYFM